MCIVTESIMIEEIKSWYNIEHNNKEEGMHMQLYKDDCVLRGFRIIK